jgi:hypothetical protein
MRTDPELFGEFLRARAGYSNFGEYQANLYLSSKLRSPQSKNRFMQSTIYSMQYFTLDDYEACIKEHGVDNNNK